MGTWIRKYNYKKCFNETGSHKYIALFFFGSVLNLKSVHSACNVTFTQTDTPKKINIFLFSIYRNVTWNLSV